METTYVGSLSLLSLGGLGLSLVDGAGVVTGWWLGGLSLVRILLLGSLFLYVVHYRDSPSP